MSLLEEVGWNLRERNTIFGDWFPYLALKIHDSEFDGTKEGIWKWWLTVTKALVIHGQGIMTKYQIVLC